MSTPPNSETGAGHGADEQPMPGARLAEELRLLLDALAERAQPVLNRLAAGAGEQGEHVPATCGWCPLCAGLAMVRGERPELAVRAAEHATGLLTVLRAALADHAPADHRPPADPDGAPADEPDAGRVQHIPVRRRDRADDNQDSTDGDGDRDGEC